MSLFLIPRLSLLLSPLFSSLLSSLFCIFFLLLFLLQTQLAAYGQSSSGLERIKADSAERLRSGSTKDQFLFKNKSKTSDQNDTLLIGEEEDPNSALGEQERRDLMDINAVPKGEPLFFIEKVKLIGVSVVAKEDLYKLIAKDLNRNYTLSDFKQMIQKVVRYYRRQGYVLAKVTVPDQKLVDKTVEVIVTEGRIDRLEFKNDSEDPAPDRVVRYIRRLAASHLKTNLVLSQIYLEKFLVLANQISGTSVNVVLSPSEKIPGGAILTVVIKYPSAIGVDYQVNNHGSEYLGTYLAQLSGRYYNPIVIGELGGAVLKTPTSNEMIYGQLYWQQYLSKSGLKLISSYDMSQSNPDGSVSGLKLQSESNSWMVGLTMPLMTSFAKLYAGTIKWNQYRGKMSYNKTIPIYYDRVNALRIGSNFNFFKNRPNSLSSSTSINLEFSRGFKISESSNTATSRVGGREDFNKFNAEFARDTHYRIKDKQYWPSWLIGVSGQKSFVPLLSVEEIGFGGQEYGRGYDSGSFCGDSGLLAKAEGHLNAIADQPLLNRVDVYLFTDAGVVYNHGNITTQDQSNSAVSAGGGANLFFPLNIRGNFFVAKPISRDEQNLVNRGKDGRPFRFYFSLGGSF